MDETIATPQEPSGSINGHDEYQPASAESQLDSAQLQNVANFKAAAHRRYEESAKKSAQAEAEHDETLAHQAAEEERAALEDLTAASLAKDRLSGLEPYWWNRDVQEAFKKGEMVSSNPGGEWSSHTPEELEKMYWEPADRLLAELDRVEQVPAQQ